jgi:hypothetical protein
VSSSLIVKAAVQQLKGFQDAKAITIDVRAEGDKSKHDDRVINTDKSRALNNACR